MTIDTDTPSPGGSLGFPNTILLLIIIIASISYVYVRFCYVDFGPVRGIPEVPGGSWLHGHLQMLGKDHATAAERWSKEYQMPIFQMRLGNRRAIVLNTFEAARDWIVLNQAATVDRPWLYTFHGIISKTSASTIGTNPWNERTKKQRRVVGSLTTATAMQRLESLLDLETSQMVSGMLQDGSGGRLELSPHIYQKRLALNIMMMFCYGERFSDIDDPLLVNILEDARIISSFRSTNANAQDYIPYLRYYQDKERMKIATAVRSRRDQWLTALLEKVRHAMSADKSKRCVASTLLANGEDEISRHDVKTILGGLMSGGFETVFATAIAGIGFLASPGGQDYQSQMYDDILNVYQTPEEAFTRAVSEEKSEFVAAFVREVLRFYPPLHFLPPRQTFKDFEYHGSTIPKGLMVFMNAQAINHDPSAYGPDAHVFRPQRWLENAVGPKVPAPYHFSFGAGARACTAVNFSNRILYSIFLRLVVSFKITESAIAPPCTHHVNYNRDTTAAAAIPKDFKARFQPRCVETLQKCLSGSVKDAAEVNNGIIK